MILDALEELGQIAHIHVDFLFEVIGAVHALEDVFRDVEVIAPRVLHGDAISLDRLHLQVSRLGEVLLGLKLFRVPKRFTLPLNFLS